MSGPGAHRSSESGGAGGSGSIARMRAQLQEQVARALRRQAAPRRTLYLVAPAGHPNFGDELIARSWLEHLARVCPDDDVVLDCHTPGQAALLLRGAHPRVVFVDTLWRLLAVAGEEPRDVPPWEWVARTASSLGVAPRLDEGIALLHRADSIHVLGGGYINGVWPHHVSLVTAIAAAAERFGSRAVATGQGLMPAQDGEPGVALLRAAESFSVFDTRDGPSFDAITGVAGASRTGDDAWLSVGGPRAQAESGSGADGETEDTEDTEAAPPGRADAPGGVVLCLQSDLAAHFRSGELAGPEAVAHWTRRVLDEWGVDGSEVTAVEGIPGHDRVVFELLGDRLAGARFVPFREAWHHGLPLDPAQTWISTRFHLHLLAAAAGASGVAVATEPGYYEVKHDSLVAAGSRWTIVGDGDTIPRRPTAGGFDRAHRAAAVDAKTALAAELYPLR